ncbi:lipoprotein insertase outer membrane protein LolB [Shewanella loihica]|uniref:Outer-membrane lipoprotein LolB n=1 Tax=Shewanella loihica (strain ATCC BAA-1088 / PV-4) TaxID=323850 RepID=LOLB_SHELP|nr:lipoprotein insertase outer membrane protein LolB [Shewanella loihica]A3QH32.1 RecName: Full=Outer-membrane lipoprotein LolB; Flags: Precursor [Shewanella loihica PV-4]ABO24780.1 outer membrane lipoprotein LolB [Shewanella loihica PV-4]
MNNLNYFTKISASCAALALMTLAGCASHKPIDYAPTQVESANQAEAWELQGKLAVRTPEDKFSTNLYWFHTQTNDDLTLTTMLGTTVMTLNKTPSQASLQIEDKVYQDSDAEELLRRLTGWSIPVDTLPLWITGQVSAQDEVVAVDEQGRPKEVLNHTGSSPWHVSFNSWQEQSGAELPRLLQLERDDIRLKLQVSQWQALTPKRASQPESTDDKQ